MAAHAATAAAFSSPSTASDVILLFRDLAKAAQSPDPTLFGYVTQKKKKKKARTPFLSMQLAGVCLFSSKLYLATIPWTTESFEIKEDRFE